MVLACRPEEASPARDGGGAPAVNAPAAKLPYAGSRACSECHREAFELWKGSHHQLAMQEASPGAVLGNFENASVTVHGVTSSFFRREGKFFIRTEGPDGRLGDYPVAYVFGLRPLQQFLVPFPGGRFQAVGLAWDTHAKETGGQRWFSLYPDERIAPGDELHWTKLLQNWNFMCAECHSTNLLRRYDAAANSYRTTWSEISVGCEACHGPGSRHVAESRLFKAGKGWPEPESKGLEVVLRERAGIEWAIDTKTGLAKRSRPPAAFRAEAESCAPCHARRSTMRDGRLFGRPLADSYRVSLLEPPLYFADGQIRDEVYEYGSFLQSRMYGKGVSCSDCHNPHSGKIRVIGNSLCAACHAPERFDTPGHHFHRAGSKGAECIACHMPTRTYMVVHPRRDHSFRVPRPDLTTRLGVPNACEPCHRDRSPAWAEAAVSRWYGEKRRRGPHFADAFSAAEENAEGAGAALIPVISDSGNPGIVRATALAMLGPFLDPTALPALQKGLSDPDPLVRFGAARSLEAVPPRERLDLARPLLSDTVLSVRVEAARALASVPAADVPFADRDGIARGLAEYRATQMANAETPTAHMNLGLVEAALGDFDAAARAYGDALRIDPGFLPAYVNSADLERRRGRDSEGERLLREALRIAPKNADVHHALGLLLVRERRIDEALSELSRAAALAPENARYAYVLAVGLDSAAKALRAREVLEQALRRHPADRGLLSLRADWEARQKKSAGSKPRGRARPAGERGPS